METLNIIDTPEALEDLTRKAIQVDKFISVDTETNGTGRDAQVIGFSVCWDPKEAYYVILDEYIPEWGDKEETKQVKELTEEELEGGWKVIKEPKTKRGKYTLSRMVKIPLQGKLKPLATRETAVNLIKVLKDKKLVMHNAVFDCRVIKSEWGIELIEQVHTDTMLLAHLLDENRRVGLKELGKIEFGEDSTKEKEEMIASIEHNGGSVTRSNYELYKADAKLIAKYGAKDTILTLKLFYKYVPQLFKQGLDKFFYEDESMPLLRTVTYEMNTAGLKVDVKKLDQLTRDLTKECAELKQDILDQIHPYVKERYPRTNEKTTFNINSTSQLSWLLFIKLNNEFKKLTPKGREVAKEIMGKVPYAPSKKIAFIKELTDAGMAPEKFIQCDKNTLLKLAEKYSWVAKLVDYRKAEKILNTYSKGIKDRMQYGVVYPSFLQHGTTGGRYSSKDPNFQNLPRDDKRVKDCIVARPGKVFIGADYSQLEPRIFASVTQDPHLVQSFARGEDIYSVVGIPVFNKPECSANKKDPNWFGKNEILRNNSKMFMLASTYGTGEYKLSESMRDEDGNLLPIERCREIQENYFQSFPMVKDMMDESHELAKANGQVKSLYGRPRRIPDARKIKLLYDGVPYRELPYNLRTFLNLAVNHRIQSSAASIINRAAISFIKAIKSAKIKGVKVVMQVHDELIVECPEDKAEQVSLILKDCMENTLELPGVALIAEPEIGKTLAECK